MCVISMSLLFEDESVGYWSLTRGVGKRVLELGALGGLNKSDF